MKAFRQRPVKRTSAVTIACAALTVLGTFALLGTDTAVFATALLACAALVVKTIAAEWTSFDVNDRLFGKPRAVLTRPTPRAEPVPLPVATGAREADTDLPHAA